MDRRRGDTRETAVSGSTKVECEVFTDLVGSDLDGGEPLSQQPQSDGVTGSLAGRLPPRTRLAHPHFDEVFSK